MKKYIVKNYILKKKLNIIFSFNKRLMYIKTVYGFLLLKLPFYYFYKNNIHKKEFIFINKFFFMNMINNFFLLYKRIFIIYLVRLKLKGLGFRIRKISDKLYYFFFNYTNMYYFYIPNNILIKWYKKRLLLLSNNFILLKNIFSHILLLKKIGTYKLLGIRYPRQILLLKKGGKKS